MNLKSLILSLTLCLTALSSTTLFAANSSQKNKDARKQNHLKKPQKNDTRVSKAAPKIDSNPLVITNPNQPTKGTTKKIPDGFKHDKSGLLVPKIGSIRELVESREKQAKKKQRASRLIKTPNTEILKPDLNRLKQTSDKPTKDDNKN